MIGRYLELKAKGLNPTVELVPIQPLIGNETQGVKLTANHYDEDTGQVDRQISFIVGLNEFINEGKRARKIWNTYKNLYETLTNETFPTTD